MVITTQGDREWYASLMLNRMMFVYFVQKQDFLDDDPDYLRNRLERWFSASSTSSDKGSLPPVLPSIPSASTVSRRFGSARGRKARP